MQVALEFRCERVRATKHASRGPCRLLERRHGLAEIVERAGWVVVERHRVDLGWCFPKPQRDYDLRLSMFTGTRCAYRDCGVKFEGECDEPGPPPFPDGACRGRAICRCDSQSFCNFDGGDSSFWSCEQCSSFESVEKCSTDGLPEAGEKDCKACCFGDSGEYAPTYKPTVEPQPTYRPTTQRR